MKFTRDSHADVSIRRVEPGRIRIGKAHFERTVALTTDGVLPDYDVAGVDELTIEDFDALLETDPEIVVLGTGWRPAFAPRELTFAMARRGVGFEVMDTPAACRTFNILIAEGRRTAALLIID